MISLDAKPDLPAFHVIVNFGKGIGSDMQGRALLAFEKFMREGGVPAEVYKETAPDDSKLRRNMTKEQRENL